MPMTRAELFDRLARMEIVTTTVDHAPAFTVADLDGLAESLPGAHTKNLFLKDDKGAMALVVATSTTKVDLKQLAKRLGAGRFSFGSSDLLMTHLGVTPGAVTAFAIANDASGLVKLVFDAELMHAETINCHPLENTATTNIARDDLLRFIRATGREPTIVTLSAA